MFAIYIFNYYKEPNLIKILPVLWKEHINHLKSKELENMVLDQKWKLKAVESFWQEEDQEEESH